MEDGKGIVAIIGSGLVGKSWAIIFARSKYQVQMYDVIPNVEQSALPYLTKTLQDLEQVGLLKQSKTADEVIKRIKFSHSLEDALKGAIWIQECVPENINHKKELFIHLDNILTEEENRTGKVIDIILASSTSSIPSSSFTSNLKHKELCLVAHPVNPPHLIPVVEVVPAPYTDPLIIKRAINLLEDVGQAPVHVKKEVDSFIINRLQGALLNEAFRLIEDGVVTPDDLDKTIRDGLGLRWSFMGPFETIDLNAPGGVRDYVQRYGNNNFSLAKQQADPRKWEGVVVDILEKDRRERLPFDKLGERANWRNDRLMALMAHKANEEKKDQKKENHL